MMFYPKQHGFATRVEIRKPGPDNPTAGGKFLSFVAHETTFLAVRCPKSEKHFSRHYENIFIRAYVCN